MKFFEKEKLRLNELLPPNSKIEHIGSTSVPGLGGKGVVDILIITNKKNIDKTKKLLVQSNYEIISHVSDLDRTSFKKDYWRLFSRRRVHLHLTFLNSKTARETIKFRDNLRRSLSLQKRYEGLKKKAVKIAQGKGEIYRKLKERFMMENST